MVSAKSKAACEPAFTRCSMSSTATEPDHIRSPNNVAGPSPNEHRVKPMSDTVPAGPITFGRGMPPVIGYLFH
jgi:hypothetical protein